MSNIPSCGAISPRTMVHTPDKLNRVDFSWFVVRTLPHQEKKLAGMIRQHLAEEKNILEVYCPTHTTVNVVREGKDVQAPLFAGHVFVLATHEALAGFIHRHYPDGIILHGRKQTDGKKTGLCTIPEKQMRMFMDFNENYADKVIVLERPYSDYAFNDKTNEPNEIVKVIDGPLAGRIGYITRFRRDKRLVFNMQAFGSGQYYAVSVPHVWNFHAVRLHNAEGDRLSIGTEKARAADLLAGILQACGHGEKTGEMLCGIVRALAAQPSLTGLCKSLTRQGHVLAAQRIARLGTNEAGLLLNLARYEHDNPGYVESHWGHPRLRPFLTPTPGVEMEAGQQETALSHEGGFTEFIRKVDISEPAYSPSQEKALRLTTTYYAHIGLAETKEGPVLFANWDGFLAQYFLTVGKANERLVSGTERSDDGTRKEKLMESFRNFSPTLYKVLADEGSPVKVVQGFTVGNGTLNVMAAATDTSGMEETKGKLVKTCVEICKEINTTTHLAIWRRYLQSVWLHI